MQITPRYEGEPIITIEGPPGAVLEPLVRQRRRFVDELAALTDDQWSAPSRCEGWAVRDVVAHLITVDGFWDASVAAGLAGEPTTILSGFDPQATPAFLVQGFAERTPAELLDQFRAACDQFLDRLSALDDAGWSSRVEAPPGHVAVDVLATHALWDAWIHERDVLLPLGRPVVTEPDEVAASLGYAAVLAGGFGVMFGRGPRGRFTVAASDPDVAFTVELGGSVVLRPGAHEDDDTLRGPATELAEALSTRAPLPADAPAVWHEVAAGLVEVFDQLPA